MGSKNGRTQMDINEHESVFKMSLYSDITLYGNLFYTSQKGSPVGLHKGSQKKETAKIYGLKIIG